MITFVSAFYILESKFAKEKYVKWMSNFLPNICNFKFVIFTDKNTCFIFDEYKKNPNIKIVLVEIEDFHNYKYKKYWIKNHLRNTLLNCNKKIANGMQCHKTDWKLNMLWSEKIEFVRKASENKYFPETEWYGWCDIGYFRGNSAGDISEIQIKQWPNNDKFKKMNKNKVYYALVRRDKKYINNIEKSTYMYNLSIYLSI